jgi:hypothetical protein
VTDATGQASATWTLGTSVADSQRVEARAGSDGPAVTFRAVAHSGAPATVTALSGGGQTGVPGAPLADSLAVLVRDAYGNPAAGATVTWTATAGAGTMIPGVTTTSAAGVARTAWWLGSGSVAQTAQASVTGASASFQASVAGGGAPIVGLDSAWVGPGDNGGYAIRAQGHLSWISGLNPTVWFEWSTSPTLAAPNATQQVVFTRTDITSAPFQAVLTPYTPYDSTVIYYRMAAASSAGVARTEIRSFRPPPPPASPQNVRATFNAARETVVLQWDGGPMSVVIERMNADSSWSDPNEGTIENPSTGIYGSSYEDMTFDVNRTSAGPYRIRRVCADQSACPWVSVPAVAITPLAPPSGLSAALNGTGVTLTWTDNASNEYAYALFRNGVRLKLLPANTTTYTDFATVSGTTYAYAVRAIAVYRPVTTEDPTLGWIGQDRSSHPSNTVQVTIP